MGVIQRFRRWWQVRKYMRLMHRMRIDDFEAAFFNGLSFPALTKEDLEDEILNLESFPHDSDF